MDNFNIRHVEEAFVTLTVDSEMKDNILDRSSPEICHGCRMGRLSFKRCYIKAPLLTKSRNAWVNSANCPRKFSEALRDGVADITICILANLATKIVHAFLQ